MRKPIIAGNWKMFKTRDEALRFIYAVSEKMPSIEEVDSVICAPFTVLRCLVKRQGENLRIGAQNMHFEKEGAFTGEVSATMLRSINVSYVIIGHSERRAMFLETDDIVSKKLVAALSEELIPILCIGETLEERESGRTNAVLEKQLELDLVHLTKEQVAEIVIAYEPIWAIGTGKTATSEVANDACRFIRQKIAQMFDQETANSIRIQYGGSVKLNNIDELMSMSDIDGALIGGASLIADDFVKLVLAAKKK